MLLRTGGAGAQVHALELLQAPLEKVAADVEAGKTAFKKCALCHTTEAGKNKIGPSLFAIVAVLGVIGWVQYARVIRGQTLTLRQREFVVAARLLGAGTARILARHILPNALGPVLAIGALNVSAMILAEASLSFLGVGVRPPTPAWGNMLSEGRDVFRVAWWTAVFPGVAIAWTVVGVNLVTDAWLRPRT